LEREWALRGALTIVLESRDESWRAKTLKDLVPQLSESLIIDAAAGIETIEGEAERATVLAALAVHLPESHLEDAVANARAIRDAGSRAWALAHLGRRLPIRFKAKVWGEACLACFRALVEYLIPKLQARSSTSPVIAATSRRPSGDR
jgi:hypothetical protein